MPSTARYPLRVTPLRSVTARWTRRMMGSMSRRHTKTKRLLHSRPVAHIALSAPLPPSFWFRPPPHWRVSPLNRHGFLFLRRHLLFSLPRRTFATPRCVRRRFSPSPDLSPVFVCGHRLFRRGWRLFPRRTFYAFKIHSDPASEARVHLRHLCFYPFPQLTDGARANGNRRP